MSPWLVRRALVAVEVQDLDVAAGGGFAHRARAHLQAGEVADQQGVLRLAVAVVDRDAVKLLPPLYDRRVEGLARRDGVPDPREIRPLELAGLGQQTVLGRGLAQDGYAVSLYEVEALARLEATLVEEDLRTKAPRSEQDVPDALGPPGTGGAPETVAFLKIEPVSCLHPLGVGVAVGVQNAFGVLGGPGGVEDERAVVRRRVLRLEPVRGRLNEVLEALPAVPLDRPGRRSAAGSRLRPGSGRPPRCLRDRRS